MQLNYMLDVICSQTIPHVKHSFLMHVGHGAAFAFDNHLVSLEGALGYENSGRSVIRTL